MPVSSSSMKMKYSFKRSLIDEEANIASGVSRVVSRIKKRLMPSTPME